MNLYKYLKKNKTIILQGSAAGGLPDKKGKATPLLQNPPCNENNGFEKRYFNPYILTIRWDSNFDNGIVNCQLDEYFNNIWNRTLGVGTVFPDFIHFNETDGVEGSVYVHCNEFFYKRNRYDDINKGPLLMCSSDGKIISKEEKEKALLCDDKKMNIDLYANSLFSNCNGDSYNIQYSSYYAYYCLGPKIKSWDVPLEGQPPVGSLYVISDPQLPECSKIPPREGGGFASVIYKITFEEILKAKDIKQPIFGYIIGNPNSDDEVEIDFEITFQTELPSGKCVPDIENNLENA